MALDALLSEFAYEFLDGLSVEERALWDEVQDDFIARPVRENNTIELASWEPGEMVTIVRPFLVMFRFENPQVLQIFRITWFDSSLARDLVHDSSARPSQLVHKRARP